ncbi:hypothetical protein K523DRAFT_394561, partial [Schizophyllum commune Tattone D]
MLSLPPLGGLEDKARRSWSKPLYARGVGLLESAEQARFDRYAGALLGWRLLPETVGDSAERPDAVRALRMAHTRRFNRCMLLFGSSRGMFTELTAMRRTLGLWAWRRLPNLFFPDHRPHGVHPHHPQRRPGPHLPIVVNNYDDSYDRSYLRRHDVFWRGRIWQLRSQMRTPGAGIRHNGMMPGPGGDLISLTAC